MKKTTGASELIEQKEIKHSLLIVQLENAIKKTHNLGTKKFLTKKLLALMGNSLFKAKHRTFKGAGIGHKYKMDCIIKAPLKPMLSINRGFVNRTKGEQHFRK